MNNKVTIYVPDDEICSRIAGALVADNLAFCMVANYNKVRVVLKGRNGIHPFCFKTKLRTSNILHFSNFYSVTVK